MSNLLTVPTDESRPRPATASDRLIPLKDQKSGDMAVGPRTSGFSAEEIEDVLSLTLDPPPLLRSQVVTVSNDGRTVKIDEKWMLPDLAYPFRLQGERFHAILDSQTENIIVYSIEEDAAE